NLRSSPIVSPSTTGGTAPPVAAPTPFVRRTIEKFIASISSPTSSNRPGLRGTITSPNPGFSPASSRYTRSTISSSPPPAPPLTVLLSPRLQPPLSRRRNNKLQSRLRLPQQIHQRPRRVHLSQAHRMDHPRPSRRIARRHSPHPLAQRRQHFPPRLRQRQPH